MSRICKMLVIIIGMILLLIVFFFIVLVIFDWNWLKLMINQKVFVEFNCLFVICGDFGVVWEWQLDECGWCSWILWFYVYVEDIVLGNLLVIFQVIMIYLLWVEVIFVLLVLLSKMVYLLWIKLEQFDVWLICLVEDNNNWIFQLVGDKCILDDSVFFSWFFCFDNIFFDCGIIVIDDKIICSDIIIFVDFFGKLLLFSEVIGIKDCYSVVKSGDYVFGLLLKGCYKGQLVIGNGKIGGMLVLCSVSVFFLLQGDFYFGNIWVVFSGMVSDLFNVGGIDLWLKFVGDLLCDFYDLIGVLLLEMLLFFIDGCLCVDFM